MGASRYRGAINVDGEDMTNGYTDFALRSSLSVQGTPEQHLQFAGVNFGKTSVLHISATPGLTVVRPMGQSHDNLVCLFVQGDEVGIDPGTGVPVKAAPGSCWSGVGLAELGLAWRTNGRILVATLPLQVLRDFGLLPSSGLTQLRAGSALLSPTTDFLRSIVDDSIGISSVAAYFMEKLIHEMVGGLFLDNHGAGPSGRKPTIYHRAISYIAASAGDPTLTPDALSQELNVSLRQLQREFQKRNTSVAERIRQTRIDMALRILTDTSLAMLSLDQVAAHSGFTSSGHLRRTLRGVGISSPRHIRAVGAGSGTESLLDHQSNDSRHFV